MDSILKNYQKEVKMIRNKLLNTIKKYYKDKPLKIPFSKKDIDKIHKIIITYYCLSKNDLKIIIHNEDDEHYYFCLLNPLMMNIQDEIKKILEIITNLKWVKDITLGCGSDGVKYCYHISNMTN